MSYRKTEIMISKIEMTDKSDFLLILSINRKNRSNGEEDKDRQEDRDYRYEDKNQRKRDNGTERKIEIIRVETRREGQEKLKK